MLSQSYTCTLKKAVSTALLLHAQVDGGQKRCSLPNPPLCSSVSKNQSDYLVDDLLNHLAPVEACREVIKVDFGLHVLAQLGDQLDVDVGCQKRLSSQVRVRGRLWDKPPKKPFGRDQ